jgi:hypothetical protein
MEMESSLKFRFECVQFFYLNTYLMDFERNEIEKIVRKCNSPSPTTLVLALPPHDLFYPLH